MNPPLRFVEDSYATDPGLDTAVSRALLLRVSDGELPETLRLHVPGRVVAFGKRDTLSPSYAVAVAAARERSFEAVERLVGGRAAVFHEGTFAFSWSIPDPDPRPRIHERFRELAGLVVGALGRLGVPSEIGELPGEYCPGAFSVHSGGIKVMGVGQRLAKRAAHVGGVIVVAGSRAVRDVLVPVYEALDIPWDPATAGAIQDVRPAVTMQAVSDALVAEITATRPVVASSIDAGTLEMARRLAPEHVPS